jgi:hypothetical protein
LVQTQFDVHSGTTALGAKGPLRQNGHRHKSRYGSDNAWKQHRLDGPDLIASRQAERRYGRALVQEAAADFEDDFDLCCEKDWCDDFPFETVEQSGAFDTSTGERHLTLDVGEDFPAHVFLHYGAHGQLTSAHCRQHRW